MLIGPLGDWQIAPSALNTRSHPPNQQLTQLHNNKHKTILPMATVTTSEWSQIEDANGNTRIGLPHTPHFSDWHKVVCHSTETVRMCVRPVVARCCACWAPNQCGLLCSMSQLLGRTLVEWPVRSGVGTIDTAHLKRGCRFSRWQ